MNEREREQSTRAGWSLDGPQIAAAIGAEVLAEGGAGAPTRATIDSREAGAGDLFFGLRGAHLADGGEFAPAAIEAGAWGVVISSALRTQFVPHSGKKRGLGQAGAWVFAVE